MTTSQIMRMPFHVIGQDFIMIEKVTDSKTIRHKAVACHGRSR